MEAALNYKVLFCCLLSLTVINWLTERGFKYPERKTTCCWPEPLSFNLIKTPLQKTGVSLPSRFAAVYTHFYSLNIHRTKALQAPWIKLKSTSFRRGNKSRRYRSMSSYLFQSVTWGAITSACQTPLTWNPRWYCIDNGANTLRMENMQTWHGVIQCQVSQPQMQCPGDMWLQCVQLDSN